MSACPNCKSKQTTVNNSRPSGSFTRRRRKCKSCGTRWTTFEIAEEQFTTIKQILQAYKKISIKANDIKEELDKVTGVELF